MVGTVDQHDGVVGEGRVEVIDVQFAALNQVRAVIAVPDDPIAGLESEFAHMLLQHGHEVGDAADRSGGHALNVGPLHHLEGVHEMTVGVDERGHQSVARQIDDDGIGALGGHHVGLRAHRQDCASRYRDRFGLAAIIDHRQHGSIAVDGVSRGRSRPIGGSIRRAVTGGDERRAGPCTHTQRCEPLERITPRYAASAEICGDTLDVSFVRSSHGRNPM